MIVMPEDTVALRVSQTRSIVQSGIVQRDKAQQMMGFLPPELGLA